MKHLVSMTDFVLEVEREIVKAVHNGERLSNYTSEKRLRKIFNYANFLKQPLTLGMFLPCVEEGNVLEEPRTCCSGSECGCMGMPYNYSSREELDEYEQAKERVLFKGFELQGNKLISKIGEMDLNLINKIKIEDITGSIELTESALKQIGL